MKWELECDGSLKKDHKKDKKDTGLPEKKRGFS